MSKLPRVGVILTGGTIDSVGTDRLDLAWYIEAGKRLEKGELLGQIPELGQIADVREIPFRRLPSQALTTSDWLDLVRTIHAIFEKGDVDGLVITHGTNTLEETAYFLNLTLKTDKPVVLVGAMRPSNAISADGYLNILSAVRVAAAPQSRGMGCLVVMNDTIFGARDVTKTATYRVNSFQARDLGPLGYADADGSVIFYHRPMKKHTVETEFDVSTTQTLPRVDVVLFLSGVQAAHLDQVAREMGLGDAVRRGLAHAVVASIGPSTSAELRRQGIGVDLDASHPKMGQLVRDAAERAGAILRDKER